MKNIKKIPKKKFYYFLAITLFSYSLFSNHFFYANAKTSFNDEERELIELINDYRSNNGLKKISVSEKLTESATYMAENMSDSTSETDPQNRNVSQRTSSYGYSGNVVENLAVGYTKAEDVFNGWKNSETYRARLLDSTYVAMGLAFEERNTSYKGYWSCVLGDASSKSDTLSSNDYEKGKSITVTIIDKNKKKIEKAKVKITIKKNGKTKTLASKTTDEKGEAKITYYPLGQTTIYVKVSKSGYETYTKKIKTTSKTTKIWLQ